MTEPAAPTSRVRWRALGPALAFVLAACALLTAWQTFRRVTFGYYDGGILLSHAFAVSRGLWPHRDFYSNYPLGIYATLALLMRWFRNAPRAIVVLGGLLQLIIAGLAGRVAGRVQARSFDLVGAAVTLLWISLLPCLPFAWMAGLGIALGCLGLADHWCATEAPAAAAATGLCWGSLAMFRHDLFVYFTLAAGGALLSARLLKTSAFPPRRQLWLCAAVLGAAVLLEWAPVLAAAPWRKIVDDLFLDQIRYVMPSRRLPLPNLLFGGGPPGAFEAAVVLVLMGPAFALGVCLLERRATGRVSLTTVLLLALAAAVLPQMLGRTDNIHALFTVTPALLAFLSFARRALGTPRMALAVLVLLPPVALAQSELRSRPAPPTLLGTPGDGSAEVVRYLRSHAAAEDRLFVAQTSNLRVDMNHVDLYFRSQRLPATRYMQFDPGLIHRPEVQRELVEDLQRAPHPWVVLVDSQVPLEALKRAPGSDILDVYLARSFKQVFSSGSFHVLERKG